MKSGVPWISGKPVPACQPTSKDCLSSGDCTKVQGWYSALAETLHSSYRLRGPDRTLTQIHFSELGPLE